MKISPAASPASLGSTRPDEDITTTCWQQFTVTYRFPVLFTRQLFAVDNRVFVDTLRQPEPDKRHRLIVFVDDGLDRADPLLCPSVQRYCAAHRASLDLACAPCIIAGGERIKQDWQASAQLRDTVAEQALDRHSYIVAIGGGALLDAVGFVAATAHRGIRHVRVPSTVLAQNDSGVGVKNALNQYGQKNYLGTFAPPFAVFNDSALLDGLCPRDRRAGMAEAVKVALIRDRMFFHWLEQNADTLAGGCAAALDHLIRRCAELHMHQIGHGGDPFEFGSARPLDFGHWAAHRIEALSEHHLPHGEAVALGIALDTRYSVLCGLLAPGVDERVARLLAGLGFTLWHPLLDPDGDDLARVIDGLEHFRAHLGGTLTITLLEDIGVGLEVHDMDSRLIDEAVRWLQSRVA